MKSIIDVQKSVQLNESLEYDKIIEKLTEAKENNIPLDEGILGAIAGATAGVVFGPKVMTTICNVLGINIKSPLGDLMTSKLINAAVAGKLGYRL